MQFWMLLGLLAKCWHVMVPWNLPSACNYKRPFLLVQWKLRHFELAKPILTYLAQGQARRARDPNSQERGVWVAGGVDKFRNNLRAPRFQCLCPCCKGVEGASLSVGTGDSTVLRLLRQRIPFLICQWISVPICHLVMCDVSIPSTPLKRGS